MARWEWPGGRRDRNGPERVGQEKARRRELAAGNAPRPPPLKQVKLKPRVVGQQGEAKQARKRRRIAGKHGKAE